MKLKAVEANWGEVFIETVHIPRKHRLPRLSDFAVWGEAAGPAFGWEQDAVFDAYIAQGNMRREEDAEGRPCQTQRG